MYVASLFAQRKTCKNVSKSCCVVVLSSLCVVWQPCAEWSMDSGCGTCTTGLTSVISSVVSRTPTSEAQSVSVAQQSSSNGSYQQAAVTQPARRPPPPARTVPATCPAKPQRQQPAISQYDAADCFFVLLL